MRAYKFLASFLPLTIFFLANLSLGQSRYEEALKKSAGKRGQATFLKSMRTLVSSDREIYWLWKQLEDMATIKKGCLF